MGKRILIKLLKPIFSHELLGCRWNKSHKRVKTSFHVIEPKMEHYNINFIERGGVALESTVTTCDICITKE